jgi:hypothetical protein
MDDKKNEAKPISMGIGKLADRNNEFVRKFRWTLEGNGLESDFIKKVKFYFELNHIHIEAYEILRNNRISIDEWLERDLSKESLLFTTYDASGNPIYSYKLDVLYPFSSCSEFDYNYSDISTKLVKLHYKYIEKTIHMKQDISDFDEK